MKNDYACIFERSHLFYIRQINPLF